MEQLDTYCLADVDAAAGRLDTASHHGEECRLTGPVWSGDDESIARCQAEVDLIVESASNGDGFRNDKFATVSARKQGHSEPQRCGRLPSGVRFDVGEAPVH